MHFSPSDKPESFGHYFIVGLSGTTLDDSDKKILGRLKPAGILLLKRNFDHAAPYPKWLSSLKDLIKQVCQYAERDKIIVSLDHEGERVMRTPPPMTVFPNAMKFRKHSDAVARAMAIELKSMGVNLSWAPVADIHSNPGNPIIGERAFGTTVKEVVEATVPFMKALDKEGVLSCAKHYPGHGDTSTDSHLELPLLDLTETQLRDRELVPFKELVDAGVPFIMTAHILYPNIDKLWPATLSEKILGDFLRKQMGYEGIVVSDDLDMKAVSEAFKQADTLARAFKAGCDMFIVARNPDGKSDRPLVLADCIVESLRKRTLSENTLHASFVRIKSLFEKRVNMYEPKELPKEIFEEHADLARRVK